MNVLWAGRQAGRASFTVFWLLTSRIPVQSRLDDTFDFRFDSLGLDFTSFHSTSLHSTSSYFTSFTLLVFTCLITVSLAALLCSALLDVNAVCPFW